MEFFLGKVERIHTSYNDYHPLKRNTTDPGQVEFFPIETIGARSSTKLAKPLMRGLVDSVAKNDLILYTDTNFGTFYLGPINIQNKPSKTTPKNPLSDSSIVKSVDNPIEDIDTSTRRIPRLSKPVNPKLDFPQEFLNNLYTPGSLEYAEANFSDLILEGRYGNSIRIGARNQNPQLIISNNNLSEIETLSDGGSIIAMMSLGTIENNFSNDTSYRLSIDKDGITTFSNDITKEKSFDYNYAEVKSIEEEQLEFDQILISSDRIIFNSTVEDVTISSNKNINIGANKNIAISNKGFSVIDSKNIYIGKQSKGRTEPMVLGDKLRELLVRILRLMADSYAVGAPPGTPTPLSVFETMAVTGTLKSEVDKIISDFNLLEGGALIPGQSPIQLSKFRENLNIVDGVPTEDGANNLASFLSEHHFIEPNRS